MPRISLGYDTWTASCSITHWVHPRSKSPTTPEVLRVCILTLGHLTDSVLRVSIPRLSTQIMIARSLACGNISRRSRDRFHWIPKFNHSIAHAISFQNLWALKLDTFSENNIPERSIVAQNMAKTFDIPSDLRGPRAASTKNQAGHGTGKAMFSDVQILVQAIQPNGRDHNLKQPPRQRPPNSGKEITHKWVCIFQNFRFDPGILDRGINLIHEKAPVNHLGTRQNTLWVFRQNLIPQRVGDHHLDSRASSFWGTPAFNQIHIQKSLPQVVSSVIHDIAFNRNSSLIHGHNIGHAENVVTP